MPPASRIPITLALALASSSALATPLIPRGLPPQTRGLQGTDDQGVSNALVGDPTNLALRYANLEQQISPGNRRYNFFWSSYEDQLPASPTPLACDASHILVPANESDRIARGYNRYHCYSLPQLETSDALLALDASIGAASTAIVYASPDWAADPACTGFPWPPSPNFRLGCLPWKNFDDWEDFINLLIERWRSPWGSGKARLSGLCIWNEIQSMGWSDPSPVLPNRWNGQPWTAAEMDIYTGAIAELFIRAGRAATRQSLDGDGVMLWLSTDHFTKAPQLKTGDVGHVGLYDFLDSFWPQVANASFAWGVCVHPYDAGDPRQDLSSDGIYTFVNLKALVAEYQCKKVVEILGVPPGDCWEWPQTLMWASEQGWPQGPSMNKTLQARNICFAHGLSLSQGLWSVTHNLFQSATPSSQGGSGDFSLIDEPPLCRANLTNCVGLETYDAYRATAPGVYGVTSDHYCCTRWLWGCGA
jgi:hypothetical protein